MRRTSSCVATARWSRRNRAAALSVTPYVTLLRFGLLACLGALALLACTGSPPASFTPGPADTGLAGRTFLSTRVAENGDERQLVRGTRIRLSFRDDEFGADAGCNLLGGGYRLFEGRLEVGQLSTTEMGCDPARHEQDEWLAAFLGTRPLVTLDGPNLKLQTGATTIELLDREVAQPDRPLVGTTWLLDGLVSGEAVSSVPAGVQASLVIQPGGGVMLQAGCNQGSAQAAVGEGTVELSGIALTRMACPGPQSDVERAVLEVLGAGPLQYEIEAGRLTLNAGEQGLVFRAEQ